MNTELTTILPGVITPGYLEEKRQLILEMFAKDCTVDEFALLCHLAVRFQLDPFARQIWAVKMPGKPAQIFAGRDGYLAVAIRSGVFDGMESGTKKDEDTGELIGWATVYRKDMKIPFHVEVDFKEYARIPADPNRKSLWRDKPKTMIKKVAEAQALRQAFSISGMYAPEEMGDDDDLPRMPPAKVQKSTPVAQPKPMKEIENLASKPVGTEERCACKRVLSEKEIAESEHTFPGYAHVCTPCLNELKKDGHKPAPKSAPPKPSPVDRVKEDLAALEKRDQPSTSSAMADEIARIQAEQDAIEQKQKAQAQDPKAGIVSVCQNCKKGVTEAERNMSKQSLHKVLCTTCLDDEFDNMKKPEEAA